MAKVSVPFASWTDALDTQQSLSVLTELAEAHLQQAGPFEGPLRKILENRDWRALCDFNFHLREPGHNPEHLLHALQVRGFFSKLESLPLGVDKEEVAWEKFQQSEEICKAQNAFWRGVYKGDITLTPRLSRRISLAKRAIRRVLGRAPVISELKLAFGPGATTSTKKKNACPSEKFGAGLQCSADLLSSGRLPEVLRELPHWCDAFGQGFYSLVPGDVAGELWWADYVDVGVVPGVLQFVPKNATTFRAIVTEPVLNSMVQHGIARKMERLLGKVGIKIDDQSINASLAWLGSVFWDQSQGVATVDLSMASDLICFWLVRVLLPDDWFALLALARTSTVKHNGTELGLHKFASMGNGTTFPLETLVFWALTHASCIEDNQYTGAVRDVGPCRPQRISGRLGVFGDDIAYPQENTPAVLETLSMCGFIINTDKSFVEGPFRESCGKDYYRGINVRPYFQKDLVSARTLCILHNFYVRSFGIGNPFSRKVVKLIPPHLRLYGPDGYGDGHLIGEHYPDHTKPKMRKKGYRGFTFETFTQEPKRITTRFPGDWVSPLYCIYTRGDEEDALLRILGMELEEQSQSVRFSKDGRPQWPVPSPNGGDYVKVKIYTLQ